MIELIGGIVIMLVGLFGVIWALHLTDRPLLQLLTYAAGMAAVLTILIGYTRAVR